VNATKFKTAIPIVTLLLAVLGGVLLSVGASLASIDINSTPQLFQGVVVFVKTVFASGVFAVGLIWLRNVWGYIGAYVRGKMQGQPQLEYDANKLYKTAAYYFGSIAIVFTAAPTPELKAVGVVIVYFLDILGSVLGEIFGKPLVSSGAK